MLTDEQIALCNAALPWESYTELDGRRMGNPNGRHYPIPTSTVLAAEREFGLIGKSVVELGCHEGAHTVGLCQFGASVIAVDARPINLAKTAVRCACYGVAARLALIDVDREPLPMADLYYHVGVLYHLTRPELHLGAVLDAAGIGLVLGTHYAPSGQPERRSEPGVKYPRAGMSDHSLWLPRETILGTIAAWGEVSILDEIEGENGPWMNLVVRKR